MAVHLVVFDLNDGNHVYDRFWTKLKSWDTYNGWISRAWFVKNTIGAGGTAEALRPLMSAKDELVVVEVTGDRWAARGVAKSGTDWLNNNVLRYPQANPG